VYTIAKNLRNVVKNLVVDFLPRKKFHDLNVLKECISVLDVTAQQYSLSSILLDS
jgi:hypothetical protein